MGRFINADARVSTGQGILGNNMFAYCRSNPVSRIDISGFMDVQCDDLDVDPNKDNKDFFGGGGNSAKQGDGTKNSPYMGGTYTPGQYYAGADGQKYQPPKGGGGVTDTVKVGDVQVDFGHGARHATEVGYNYIDVQYAIAEDAMNFPFIPGTAIYVNIIYGPSRVTYSYYTLDQHHISIGTFYFDMNFR